MALSGWTPNYIRPGPSVTPYDPYAMPNPGYAPFDNSDPYAPQAYDFGQSLGPTESNASLQQQASTYLDPNFWNSSVNTNPVFGLSSDQRMELMQNLETTGMGDIEMMIAGANSIFNPGQNRRT